MKDCYIWGTGEAAENYLPVFEKNGIITLGDDCFRILGVIDNDTNKHNTLFHGLPVMSPTQLIDKKFSKIIVLCEKPEVVNSICTQAMNDCGIPKEKIITTRDLKENNMENLKSRYIEKYSETEDPEIREMLKYWENNKLTVFNNWIQPSDKVYEVEWDRHLDLPYIWFETVEGKRRRMYYPRNHYFNVLNNKQVMGDVMYEQRENSPHLYITDKHKIEDGDVMFDGGVCEGNFALRYIDIVSKAYLVECDSNWNEALHYTFKDYEDKIVFCNKKLSDRVTDDSITIDGLVNGKLNFLKLDIEGAEISALWGGVKTLQANEVKCSICSYHRHDDENQIREFFRRQGYKTEVSKGYMTFVHSSEVWYNPDFRRGIVYAAR